MTAPREEWGVRCRDGIVWDEEFLTQQDAEAAIASSGCGCETDGHVVVTRVIPAWTDVA